MRAKKSGAVSIFIGALLIAIFVIGLICQKNPTALQAPHRHDYAIEQISRFCVNWWLPAGIIGFPTFLISLIICLVRESREKDQ